MKNSLL